MDELSIFSRWDGTQDVDLEYKAMLEDFFEKYLETGDVSFALEWMMQEGVQLGSSLMDLPGMNRMARELWRQRARMLSEFNPSGITGQLRKILDEIVDQELSTVRNEQSRSTGSRERMEELFSREATLTRLPQKLGEAVQRLKAYSFMDPEAQKKFQEFVSEMERLNQFIQRNRFGGGRPMSLDDARDLMEQARLIDELIRALERGELDQIDMEALAKYLGEDAKRSIERFMEFTEYLKDSGFVVEDSGRLDLSPLAVKKIGEKALKDIYNLLGKTPLGAHPSDRKGLTTPLPDQTRPFRFGDPFRPHLTRTVMNAIMRECSEGKPRQKSVQLKPEDFEILETENWARSATALLLDMSLSMFQGGRFTAAKKVALALEQLIRTRYPRDEFYLIGFATVARQLSRKELVDAAGGLGEDIFTNIQDALSLASRLLARHREARPQVILITDGQPTAFFHQGRLHVEWPIFGVAPESTKHTLKAVRKVTQQDITINTFMLDRQAPLVKFVEQMTRINQGRAFFTTPGKLGKYLLLDFLGKRKKAVH